MPPQPRSAAFHSIHMTNREEPVMGVFSKAAKRAVDEVDQHLAARYSVTGAARVAHIQDAADTVSAALDAGVTLEEMRDVRASRKANQQ